MPVKRGTSYIDRLRQWQLPQANPQLAQRRWDEGMADTDSPDLGRLTPDSVTAETREDFDEEPA